MTPAQIEGMIDRICGLFPTTQIGRNTVKNAWTKDDFLLDATVEEARLVTDWIKDNCEKFHSEGEGLLLDLGGCLENGDNEAQNRTDDDRRA